MTDGERDEIAALLRGGAPYREVARRTGRSHAVIAQVARDRGIRADRALADRTRNASAARSAYSAEARAESAAEAQGRLDEILATFNDHRAVLVPGKGVELAAPSARDLRDLASAVESLQRTVAAIHRMDHRAEQPPSVGLLVQLVDGIRAGDDS